MMGTTLSDELMVMLRPSRSYARLVGRSSAEVAHEPGVMSRSALLLLSIGTAVSLSSTGRLAPEHLFFVPLAWAFAPLLQAIVVLLTLSASGDKQLPRRRAVSLHMAGNGPYLLLMLAFALSSTALGAASPLGPGTVLWLPVFVVIGVAWGTLTSFAFYRSAVGLARGKSIAMVLLEWALKILLLLAWFSLMNNLGPQILGPRGAE